MLDITSPEPIKLVLERRVNPLAQQQFEGWLRRLMRSAAQQPGLQGSSVLKTPEGEYFILLRFVNESALRVWQTSPNVLDLMSEGNAYGSAARPPTMRMGLETWFTLPGMPAAAAPPKWKMALITWLALLPQVIALSFLIPHTLPFPLGIMISTAIPVAMLAWVVMPQLTRWLYGWLYVVDAAKARDVAGPARAASPSSR